jgi:epoxyqueuosine reductase QueG
MGSMAKNDGDLKEKLREACRNRGAVAFGIASVDEADALEKIKIGSTVDRWSTKIRSKMPEAKTAVIFGLRSFDDADELVVERPEEGEWYPGYFPLTHMRRDVLQILRNQGFRANPLPDLVPLKRIAILAGLGVYGKNSVVLSPKYGLWLRLEGVITDAELPIDKPLNKDLCGKCERCVKACPAKALKPYVLDSYRCLVGYGGGSLSKEKMSALRKRFEPRLTPNTYVMCRVCQMVCPFTTAERRKNTLSPQRSR